MTAARVRPGVISLSNSSHFPLVPYSNRVKPVTLPPGRAKLATNPPPDRVGGRREHDRHGAGRLQQRGHIRSSTCHNDVRRERNQFDRKAASAVKIAPSPASVDPDVAAFRPPGLQQPLPECGGKGLSFLVALDMHHQQPDPPHALSQLRPRRERPRRRRAAECGQQFPPSDGDGHTPLPREVREDNDTTPRACCPNSAATAPTFMALSSRWRSRPQHQQRTHALQQTIQGLR